MQAGFDDHAAFARDRDQLLALAHLGALGDRIARTPTRTLARIHDQAIDRRDHRRLRQLIDDLLEVGALQLKASEAGLHIRLEVDQARGSLQLDAVELTTRLLDVCLEGLNLARVVVLLQEHQRAVCLVESDAGALGGQAVTLVLGTRQEALFVQAFAVLQEVLGLLLLFLGQRDGFVGRGEILRVVTIQILLEIVLGEAQIALGAFKVGEVLAFLNLKFLLRLDPSGLAVLHGDLLLHAAVFGLGNIQLGDDIAGRDARALGHQRQDGGAAFELVAHDLAVARRQVSALGHADHQRSAFDLRAGQSFLGVVRGQSAEPAGSRADSEHTQTCHGDAAEDQGGQDEPSGGVVIRHLRSPQEDRSRACVPGSATNRRRVHSRRG